MGVIAETICRASERNMAYAERLLTDVRPDMSARFPTGTQGPVVTNHPTFVYGHLALYPAKILSFLQVDPAPASGPEDWEALFNPSAQCQDDVEGTIYPAFSLIRQAFFDYYPMAHAAIREADEALFAKPCPYDKYQEAFGSNGAAINYIMNNHLMNHFGQVSAWRRFQGLGAC